ACISALTCLPSLSYCGYQENPTNDEPNFPVFEKCEVNGENARPHFEFLKESLPFPPDNPSLLCAADILHGVLKSSLLVVMGAFQTYSRRFETIKMQDDI
uniref:Uncharacterized protein n=1 Tax=Naja naja TaxID=35670 RepID=A0A8C7DZP0_NAJNA